MNYQQRTRRYQDFYAEIGKVIYAMSEIDGVITESEKEALHNMIKRELAPIEDKKDAFGTNIAYFAEIAFDYLDENTTDAETLFLSFIDYLKGHKQIFDATMKRIGLFVADQLSKAYEKSGKREKQLIAAIKNELEQMPVTAASQSSEH